jgi:hypothetical protein
MALRQEQPVISGVFDQTSAKGQLCVLPPRVGQVLVGEFAESLTFVQLPHQNQATIGSHSRSLEINLQGSIERELKGLVLLLTQWVWTSKACRLRLDRHKYR